MKTEVLVTGTFNIVHPGHVRLLEFAAQYGEVTVGINTDNYVQRKYGKNALPLIDRSYVLESISHVSKVIAFREDEPSKLIEKLKPKYYIKGPDYDLDELPELKILRKIGATVIIHPTGKEYNSSDLVKALPKSAFNTFDKYS
tara:strand:- start:26 stop:454 length:429 start_codon:yes stop_codon:yes gene_type:complete